MPKTARPKPAVPPFLQFEYLVKDLLKLRGFQPLEQLKEDVRIDVVASKNAERWVIEIKFYRTARPQLALLESAASTVVTAGQALQAAGGMLIVSSLASPLIREAFQQRFGVTLVDRSDLLDWAASAPHIADALSALIEMPAQENVSLSSEPRAITPSSGLRTPPDRQPDTVGDLLCNELRNIKKGKDSWRTYELHCERILKYLFPNDLSGWHQQKRTDDGLNRFDYVCRIRPTTEFWRFLIDHLNSRYVLFEFKNYVGQVKQGQILTTEKYLLERGLRRVAIVFTRSGAQVQAILTAQGAMREHGKLMLIVSDQDVCRMLSMKQRGEDPTDLLFDLADDSC